VPGSGNPAPTSTTGGNTPAPTGGSSGTGLHNKFKAKGKLYFGTEIDHYHLNNNALTTIVKNSFGQVTCENSMKWDATERELRSLLRSLEVSGTKLTRALL
jgi:endo-1,4-beta-xylanase